MKKVSSSKRTRSKSRRRKSPSKRKRKLRRLVKSKSSKIFIPNGANA